MGLLDKFAGLGQLDETQTQGLLAAASQMLQQSGPSRTPQGFGQIVGGGMEAYQGATMAAKRRKAEEDRAAMESKMYGMKMQGMESDLAAEAQKRDYDTRLTAHLGQMGGGAASGQPQQAPQLGATPQASFPGMPQPMSAPAAPAQADQFQQRIARAAHLRTGGFHREADAAEVEALKFREELRTVDNGQSNDMVNPYTGEIKASMKKAQTLESVASERSAAASRAQSARQFDVSRAQSAQQFNASHSLSRERLNSENNRFVQGGKPMTQLQETKYRTQIAKDYTSANTMLNNMDEVARSAKAVKDAPGLGGATGLSAYLPSMPDSKASQAEVKLQNLEGKVTSLGKAAAAMSGAVGPMAVQEWKIVRDMVAAIDPKKGEKSLKEQIALVEETAAGSAGRIRDGYSKHYGADFERYPQFENLAPAKSPDAPAKFSVTAPNGKEYNFPDAKALSNFKLKAGIK